MTDIDEQQPDAVLKGAEYVEYLGLYFNREKEAAAAIQHIVDNYMCTPVWKSNFTARSRHRRDACSMAWRCRFLAA